MNEPNDDTGSDAGSIVSSNTPAADGHAGAVQSLGAEALDQVVAGLGSATLARSGGDPAGIGGTRAGAGANQGAHELTHIVQQRSTGTP